MVKFFAMLKDSLREAIDGWIFFVMLALALLLVVLVFSASVEPLPADRALPRMLTGDAMRIVSPDRGTANRQAQFFFTPEVTNILANNPNEPWNGSVKFTVKLESGLFGGGAELDDDGKPKKPLEGTGLLSNSFKEAVRYWAAPAGTPGRERPPYTDALAADFLREQIAKSTGLNIAQVTPENDGSFRVDAQGIASKIFWPHVPKILFGAFRMDSLAAPLGTLVYVVENALLNGIGAWVLMLAGVVVTAGFIPNMLRKGAIDLLITKPMSRSAILIYKYLGGLLFVVLLCSVAVGGVWLAIGLRTGIWSTGVLWSILGISFYFAILYACSTLVGVLTRNAIVCIVVTIVFWFVLYLIGLGYNIVTGLDQTDFSEMNSRATRRSDDGKSKTARKADPTKSDENKADESAEPDDPPPIPDMKPHPMLVTVMKTANAVTPRLNDVDALTTQAIAHGLLSEADYKLKAKAAHKVDWKEALGVSAAWIGLFLGLALLRFVTRSY